jgi:hypothetical protein
MEDDAATGNVCGCWRFHTGGGAVVGVSLDWEGIESCSIVGREGLPSLVALQLLETETVGAMDC